MDNVKEDVEATELKVQQAIVTIINYNKKKSHVRGRIWTHTFRPLGHQASRSAWSKWAIQTLHSICYTIYSSYPVIGRA